MNEERVVVKDWLLNKNWTKYLIEDKIICTLENDEYIIGVTVGLGNIDENSTFVESFKFIIGKF